MVRSDKERVIACGVYEKRKSYLEIVFNDWVNFMLGEIVDLCTLL